MTRTLTTHSSRQIIESLDADIEFAQSKEGLWWQGYLHAKKGDREHLLYELPLVEEDAREPESWEPFECHDCTSTDRDHHMAGCSFGPVAA